MVYLARRLAAFPLTLLGVSLVVFVSIRSIPGDAVTAMLGTDAGLLTPAQRVALAGYFGIDQPASVQYGRWLAGLLRGDLGVSAIYGRGVLGVVVERFPVTLELAVLAMAVALCLGVPAGVFAATHGGQTGPAGIGAAAMLGQSTPSFVIGLVLLYALSAAFGVVPPMGSFTPPWRDPLANVEQMALPAAILGFAFVASVTRLARSTMLDVLSEDFVRTARSKGASRRRVIWRHALPNALIPIVTLAGVELGYLLGGAVVVEQIFALPGVGRLVLDAINHRDYALVEGAVLFVAFDVLVINLLVDLAYAALDPRIRLGAR